MIALSEHMSSVFLSFQTKRSAITVCMDFSLIWELGAVQMKWGITTVDSNVEELVEFLTPLHAWMTYMTISFTDIETKLTYGTHIVLNLIFLLMCVCVCVCMFQCQPTALLCTLGSAQGRWVWSIFNSCTAWADHTTCGVSICIVYWIKLRLGWLSVTVCEVWLCCVGWWWW